MIRFVLALVFVCYALPVMAADSGDVLPPPTAVQDTPAARETVPDTSGSPSLRKELTPKAPKGVQVYVYERKDGAKIEEYSMHGKVYMIHVQPPGGVPGYYLYDRSGSGKFMRLPGGAEPISPPMWVIKRF